MTGQFIKHCKLQPEFSRICQEWPLDGGNGPLSFIAETISERFKTRFFNPRDGLTNLEFCHGDFTYFPTTPTTTTTTEKPDYQCDGYEMMMNFCEDTLEDFLRRKAKKEARICKWESYWFGLFPHYVCYNR